jgi:hypothetical protein
MTESRRRFYIDYGFMWVSSSNYSRPDKKTGRVVLSYDGFSSYLLIIDEATCYIWCFLTKSKEPPTDLLDAFFSCFGHELGGSVCTNQVGKLARSSALSDLLLQKHRYVLEPTGADSPSQNGTVEIYNRKLVVRTRTLLYGSGLPAKYWSSALLHLVYLRNRLVHTTTKRTPLEAYYRIHPDLAHLKLFGSWVCVKVSGSRRGKLGRHNFKGIFFGHTATDQNIVYLKLNTGIVKQSHHAQFDEAWYLQLSGRQWPNSSMISASSLTRHTIWRRKFLHLWYLSWSLSLPLKYCGHQCSHRISFPPSGRSPTNALISHSPLGR